MRSPPPATCSSRPPTTPSGPGHLPAAAWLLHDAARLGAAADAAPRLAALATATDSALVAARAEHAAALVADDGDRLAAAAERFEALGALLLAAEAAAAGADAWRRAAGATPGRRPRRPRPTSSPRAAKGR